VPITVQIPDADVRAVLGGTGEAKCAGNYAASLRARQLATAQGCDEVLWLDAVHHRYIEELSGMNVFLVDTTGSRPTLVTPPLSGALLDGITRRSILELSEDLGFGTREELVSCDEFEDGCASGVFSEAFACGTAAVVAPIGRVRRSDGSGWQVGDGLPGPVTMRVRSSLLALQEGRIDDARGWTHLVRGDAAPA
jgi:branched-chain amino acid aminotransferase